MPASFSARRSARAKSGLRMLCAQSWMKVMPELIASTVARPRALIDVVRGELCAERRGGAEVARSPASRPTCRAASEFHICQWVSTKLRQHDHAAAVDHGRAVGIDLLVDRDDLAVAHMDMAIRDVADALFHRHQRQALRMT